MNIVGINGGLGNQICQYIFGRYLELYCGAENVMFDDMYFYGQKIHNGYELTKIFKNAKINMVKDSFDKDVWANMVHICGTSGGKILLPNVFKANGVDITLITDEYIQHKSGEFLQGYGYDGKTFNINHALDRNAYFNNYDDFKGENIYFKGAWVSQKYHTYVKEELKYELKFPEIIQPENIRYKNDMLSHDVCVGLHVRRGDFIPLNRDIPLKNYSKIIKKLKYNLAKENKKDVGYYVFSDDLNWCEENKLKMGFAERDNVVYVSGNDVDERNYIDVQLMTFCDYIIRNPNSSFSLAAGFLSEKDCTMISL